MKSGSFRVKAVNDVLFALPTGQVGPLVETPDAFYVIKADERLEGRTVPFSEVQSAIEDEVRDRKFNQTVSDYVQKLYERAYVRILTDNL
jgi:parvulin-like peptidyl-prolyl isomerase